MNNPFLSERNIFSKVVNPLKKKEVESKQQPKANQNINVRPHEKNKQSIVNTYNFYKPDKPSQNAGTFIKNQTPAQKMTFGVPNQSQRKSNFQNNYLKSNPKPEMFEARSFQSQNQEIRNYPKLKPNPYSENNREYPKERLTYQADPTFQIQSPNQQHKFEEYRKMNNFTEYSPIDPTLSKKMNDSEFLNIDALGDDLNNFLASSKNQEQLCMILGIDRIPKKNNQREVANIYQKQKDIINPIQSISASVNSKNPTTKSYTSIFSKDKKNDFEKDVYQPSNKPEKHVEQISKQSGQYIPTFNYMSMEQQNSTYSRQEQVMPSFNPVNSKKQIVFQTSKVSKSSQIQNLEVFNYSKDQVIKQTDTLQEMINKEMMDLALNGRYRTFLTSCQKIVTIKYNIEYI